VFGSKYGLSSCPMAVWPGPKKGSMPWKDQRRQGWVVVVDGQGGPIGADLDSASASEIKLLEATIEKITGPRKGVVGRGKILSAS